MAYRASKLYTVVADDSTLSDKLYERTISAYQTLDQETYIGGLVVSSSASETQVTLGTLSTAYFIQISSDYPVRLRFNSAMGTQFTLSSTNVAAVNQGAPIPDKCFFSATMQVTSLYIQPIASATQSANVKILGTGDPVSVYV